MRQTMLTVLVAAMSLVAMTAQTPTVPFPEGYRDWRHVKSMVISQGHPLFEAFGGIHHLYANELALKGYASGKFPDGSIIVFKPARSAGQRQRNVRGRPQGARGHAQRQRTLAGNRWLGIRSIQG